MNRARLAKRRARKAAVVKPHMLGVLGIMKNEEMNIREWVDHYLWQGATKVYLIDNGSTDASLELIAPYIAGGQVEVVIRPGKWQQPAHYRAAFDAMDIGACEWLAIADIDEFWFCKDGRSLRDMVATEYGPFDVVYANWSIFGSSGHKTQPPSLRRDFTLRHAGLDRHINRKWLCRTSVLSKGAKLGIHTISGANSGRTISDNESLQLNHYVIQSLEYFRKVKMTRGDASSKNSETCRDMEYFHRFDRPATVVDDLLARRVSALSSDT